MGATLKSNGTAIHTDEGNNIMLEELVRHAPFVDFQEFYLKLARDCELPVAMQWDLAHSKDPEVRMQLAISTNSGHILSHLVHDPVVGVAREAYGNPRASARILSNVLDRDEVCLVMPVADHVNTTPELADRMAERFAHRPSIHRILIRRPEITDKTFSFIYENARAQSQHAKGTETISLEQIRGAYSVVVMEAERSMPLRQARRG